MNFEFEVDIEGRRFCEEIAKTMILLFGISEEEAVRRINAEWRGQSIIGSDVVYHETEEFWANNIYFGKNSFWWKSPDGLKPKPID